MNTESTAGENAKKKGKAGDSEHTLQELEERLRCVIELSTDYYWEQDENHRFTLFQHRDLDRPENDPKLFLGKTSWELGGTPVESNGSWEEHKAVREARQPFKDFLVWRSDPCVGERYLSISGQPIFDEDERFRGYRGIARDVTKEKRHERLLRLERTVTHILVDAEDPTGALHEAIRAICRSEGWEAGQYWNLDEEARVMRFYEGWCIADPAIEEVTAKARGVMFRQGEGLVGVVWETGEALWVGDLTKETRIARKDIPQKTGWRSVLLFPVTSEGKIIGVLDFNARYIPEPDERLLQVIQVLGAQIGHYHQRALALEKLRESEEHYSSTVEMAAIGICHIDVDGRFEHANSQLCKMLGYSQEELLGLNIKEVSHPDDIDVTDDNRAKLYAGEINSFKTEKRYLCKDGTPIWVRLIITAKRHADGTPRSYISVVEDITARKETEERLRESEERFQSTVELAAIGICHVATDGRFIHVNQQLCEMLGYTREELLEKTVKDISHPEDVNVTHDRQAKLNAGEIDSFKVEKRYLRKDGTPIWVRITITAKRGADGKPLHHISIVEDVSVRKEAEERVQYLATHDEMTGLPNRALFSQLLNHAIESARRHDRKFAVLFIDLDRFKYINDSLGHEAGDTLLSEMSKRFRGCLRASDVVARLGGDEFVVLVQEINEPAQVAIVARNLLSAAIKPLEISGQECRVTASIGICMYPSEAQDEQTLMKYADMAMYLAKEEGKNNFQFYSEDIKTQSIEKLSLESNLRRAMEQNEFTLHYQAKVNFKSGEIKGVEALLRWNSPVLGEVPPMRFIPVAEEMGLIIPLGKWVMRTACEQLVKWQRQGLSPVGMSINLSPRQFADPDLVHYTKEVLDDTGIAPELLELEVTESMVMYNINTAITKLSEIKDLGVRIAIDDFGTGYSSLAQLKRFPIDTLKVDRSFIRDIPDDAEDKALTEAIIAMGRTLGLTVIAEGVETAEQQAFLSSHACDEMQGFFFSKPAAAEEFEQLLRRHKPSPLS